MSLSVATYIANAFFVFTDGVTLELVDASSDRLDLRRQFYSLCHRHFVTVTLWCRRIAVPVHAHQSFITFRCPLTLRAFFRKSLITSSESRRPTVVTATDDLEVDLTIAAKLATTQVLSLVLNDHLFEEMILLVDVLLCHGLRSTLA